MERLIYRWKTKRDGLVLRMAVVSTLVELIRLGRKSESAKHFEILLLCRQLAIYESRQERALHLSRGEKLMLVVLATKVKEK
jgi:hypothetical protein